MLLILLSLFLKSRSRRALLSLVMCLSVGALSISSTGCGSSEEPSSNSTVSQGGAVLPSGRLEDQLAGTAAHSFLRASPYTKLKIEVAYVFGRAPSNAFLTYMGDLLSNRLNKPGGMTMEFDSTLTPLGGGPVTQAMLLNLERANRRFYSSGDTLTMFVVIVDGYESLDTPTRGTFAKAFGASSIAIFRDTVQARLSSLDRDAGEMAAFGHEVGHLLGLVGQTIFQAGALHQDAASTHHCSNLNCLMHDDFSNEIGLSGLGNFVPGFDANCLNDLQAAGGK